MAKQQQFRVLLPSRPRRRNWEMWFQALEFVVSCTINSQVPGIFFSAVELVLVHVLVSTFIYLFFVTYVAHTWLCSICSVECALLLFLCFIHEYAAIARPARTRCQRGHRERKWCSVARVSKGGVREPILEKRVRPPLLFLRVPESKKYKAIRSAGGIRRPLPLLRKEK